MLKFKFTPRTVAYDALGRPAAVTVADGRTVRTAYDRFGRINSPGRRVSEFYLNEPHPTGGNPVAMWTNDNPAGREMSVAAATRLLFNDMLGSTLAYLDGEEVTPTEVTLFGETANEAQEEQIFFTGKPRIDELGYAFLFRNYRPEKSKWQTADPLGYPDGWNCLAYCNNGAHNLFDELGLNISVLSDDIIGQQIVEKTASLVGIVLNKSFVKDSDGDSVVKYGYGQQIKENFPETSGLIKEMLGNEVDVSLSTTNQPPEKSVTHPDDDDGKHYISIGKKNTTFDLSQSTNLIIVFIHELLHVKYGPHDEFTENDTIVKIDSRLRKELGIFPYNNPE